MGRFENGGFPIVRVGGRLFTYLKSKKLIIGYDSSLSALGFKEHGVVFERTIEENEIDSAYRILDVFGVYKSYEVAILEFNEETNELLVSFSNEDGQSAGIVPTIDHLDKDNALYRAYVPEKDVNEIYEIRRPVTHFAFESPRIVFHKKDGVWLPWHEYGTPLKDDEWI